MSEHRFRVEQGVEVLRAHDHVTTVSRGEDDPDVFIEGQQAEIDRLTRENAELRDVLAATQSLLDQKVQTVLVLEAALASTKVQLEQKDRSLMALEAAHAELQTGFYHPRS